MTDHTPDGLERRLADLTDRVQRLEHTLAELQRTPVAPWVAPARARAEAAPNAEIFEPGPFSRIFNRPKPEGTGAEGTSVKSADETESIERRIGSELFNRVGILAVLIGMAWFLKFAFENEWVGPAGRVIIGLLVGAGLIVWSERFRAQGHRAFSYSLKAVGSGVLYLALWASFGLYHLVPSGVAFAGMALVTAWNGIMCWTQDSEVLALYAVAGGFLTPVLASSGGNHQVMLCGYMLLLDGMVVFLLTRKPWARVLLGAGLGTLALFAAWGASYYSDAVFWQTTAFIVAFFLLFVWAPRVMPAPAEGEKPRRWDRLAMVVVPLGAAVCSFAALHEMLGHGGRAWARPWAAVLFALFYLGTTRLRPAHDPVRARMLTMLHLALAIGFLTVAIPLQASGYWIATGWLIEGAALMWVARRTDNALVRLFAAGALVLGVWGLYDIPTSLIDRVVFNPRFAAHLAALAAFGITAWLALRKTPAATTSDEPSANGWSVADGLTWTWIAAGAVIAFNLIALVAVSLEIHTFWMMRTTTGYGYEQFTHSVWWMLFGGALLGVGFWKESAFLRWQGLLLLVLSIGKVFVIDTGTLSQGYRILSFLGLGVLLLGVSFAYQRDLLGLRNRSETPPSDKGTHA